MLGWSGKVSVRGIRRLGIRRPKTLNRLGEVTLSSVLFFSFSRIAKELPSDPVGDHEISADGHGEEREVLVVCVPCEGIKRQQQPSGAGGPPS